MIDEIIASPAWKGTKNKNKLYQYSMFEIREKWFEMGRKEQDLKARQNEYL